MVDTNSFNLNPTFPMASVIDAAANKTYKEQLMRNQQQEMLMKGLDQFSGGVNNLVNRKIAIAQALAQAKLYGPMMSQMTGQPQAPAVAAPTPATTVPSSVGGADFLQGLTNGNIAVDGGAQGPTPGSVGGIHTDAHAAAMPPVPSPLPSSNPVDQQTLATALYSGAPQNPAEMIANLLKSQQMGQEKAYQSGMLGIEGKRADTAARMADVEQGYKSATLKIDNAKLALEEKLKDAQIDETTAANIRSTLTAYESRKDELIKNLPTGLYKGINNEQAKTARQELANIGDKIDSLTGKLSTFGNAKHMSTAELLAVAKGK